VDAIKNPYTPNAGARPPELAGRNQQIESFRILLGRLKAGATEKSLIITGLRGVGKTVLLNTFEDMAEADGFRTSFRELDSSSSISELLARDVQKTLLRLSLAKRLGDKVRLALSGLSAFTLKDPNGFELSVDLRKITDASMLAEDMTEIFLALGEALVSKGDGFILFLDELQFVKEHEFRALISALHRVNQKSLPISLAAAGLPNIPQLAGEARSYAERLFDFPTIGKLDPPDARAALVTPAKQRGAAYEPDALEKALELTEGYPFYLQEYGKHIWNLAPTSPITLADVDAATPIAVASLDQTIYEVRIQRATEKERRYMRAMAELGTGAYRVGRVSAKMGDKTTNLSRVRQSLVDKGLIYATEDYGFIDFTVPRFDEFMRRHMPYRAPRRKPKATP
jgi:AAA ATPase-like protein